LYPLKISVKRNIYETYYKTAHSQNSTCTCIKGHPTMIGQSQQKPQLEMVGRERGRQVRRQTDFRIGLGEIDRSRDRADKKNPV
jgi:hypothetical protein